MRPHDSQGVPLPSDAAPIHSAGVNLVARRKLARSVLGSVLIAVVAAIGLALYATWQYGSPLSAVSAIQGYALAVDKPNMSLGKLRAAQKKTVSFTVRNLKSVPVTIVGCRASCRCTNLLGLPLTIPPGGSAELTGAMIPAASDVGKPLPGEVLLYLDVPSPPIVLVFSAEIVLPAEDAGQQASDS